MDTIIDKGTFRMDWKTGKMVRCSDRPELKKGTIIWAVGPGCSEDKYAMTGNGSECVKLGECYEGEYFGPFQTVDRYALPVSERFGIGLYYDLDAEPATDGEIAAAIKRGEDFVGSQKAKAEEQARAFAEAKEMAKGMYGSLYEEKNPEDYQGAAFVARNIRRGLSDKFPGQRFSVRKTGYDSIVVSWEDGPTEKEVKAVAGLFERVCEPDKWNDDLWDHKNTAFTSVFGGVDYIRLDRSYSEGVVSPLAEEIEAECPALAGGKEMHRDDFLQTEGADSVLGRLEDNWNIYWFSSRGIAHSILSARSLYKAPKREEAKTKEGGLAYVDYSEKAFAVTGDTKPIAGKLKDLGGRFNSRLSCGAGWIFSKRSEAKVREALGI